MVYSQPAHLQRLARSILTRGMDSCDDFDGELCRRRLLFFGDAILFKTETNRYFESIQFNAASNRAYYTTNRGGTTVGIEVITYFALY